MVIRPQDQAILVLPGGLPQLDLADEFWFPDVEAPVRALREQHGIEAYVLVCLTGQPDATAYLMVNVGETPANANWVTDLDDPLVLAARNHLALPTDARVTPAWTRPAWYAEALPWIDDQLTGAATPRTGVPTQVRSWGLSNVLRCPTAKGDVYFKAIAHSSTIRPVSDDALPLLFAHEPSLLRQVAAERPGLVPSPVAIDEERAWMLLPDLGPMLVSQSEVGVWIQAIRGHAQLQRSYADQADRLLAFSCVDRRLAVLDGELDRLFGPNPATELLEPAERAALPARAAQLREAINELAAIGVPETLLHGDLHPRNLAVRDGRVLAFDWTDAAVAHPFLDLVTFFDKRSPLSNDPRVRDGYLAEWEEYAAPAELRRALELAQELGAAHQVMTSLHLSGYLSDPSASSMIRGARWWLRALLEK
ncbi:aminoglycoside phosphotransferase family protein [Kribbella qitaiheensis]|uniref:Aminoglycoside phosphotransferase family protein n=1 Tax=Kribbella qitaiheensis TaxID=1544730 RepID=A0A7G6WX37_9ACTN|nr:aminoglycoside phosphotransferase family protein [Kribbella qitaiheensis]QNE18552.1 aminoglycoside phosphotransferase family protein [Kribbella qitaiheensis]